MYKAHLKLSYLDVIQDYSFSPMEVLIRLIEGGEFT